MGSALPSPVPAVAEHTLVSTPHAAVGAPDKAHAVAEAHAGSHGPGGEPVHQKEPGMFDINPGILVSQVINFIVLLLVLKAVLFKPLDEILEERRKKVADTLALADDENHRAHQLREKYQARIDEGEKEAYDTRQQAIGEAHAAREEIIAQAKAKAAENLEKGQAEIQRARRQAWIELREEVVRLSLAVAEKVIDTSLDEKTHRDLIRKAIDEMDHSREPPASPRH